MFIAKASLMLTEATSMQCPAENCAGGSHTPLPPACLLWWKEIGWTLMGWSGSGANASSKAVHEKISMFRRNMRRRNKGSASEVPSESSQGEIGHFGPKKFDRVGRRGQGRSKYGTFGSFQWAMGTNALF